MNAPSFGYSSPLGLTTKLRKDLPPENGCCIKQSILDFGQCIDSFTNKVGMSLPPLLPGPTLTDNLSFIFNTSPIGCKSGWSNLASKLASQNVLKLILKSPIFVLYRANMTQSGCQIGHTWCKSGPI